MLKVVQSTVTDLPQLVDQVMNEIPPGSVIGLSGALGSGKTTFVRAFMEKLIRNHQGKKPPRIVSPTFVIHQVYHDITPPVDHFDLYRMDHVNDRMLNEIGYNDALAYVQSHRGYLFVEWYEHCRDIRSLGLNATIAIQGLESSRHYEINLDAKV